MILLVGPSDDPVLLKKFVKDLQATNRKGISVDQTGIVDSGFFACHKKGALFFVRSRKNRQLYFS